LRSTPIRFAGCPALPPQVPAPVPGRIPRRDLPGLGTRLQMGDAPALATSAAARGLRGTVAERRLRRGCGPCSARRAALAPRHAVLVRENGVARRPARARRRPHLRRRPVRLPAWTWRTPCTLRTLGDRRGCTAAPADARTHLATDHRVRVHRPAGAAHLPETEHHSCRGTRL